MCPTSEFPMYLFGKPTAPSCAVSRVFGYFFIRLSVNGVLEFASALFLFDARKPHPSLITNITLLIEIETFSN